MTESHPKTDAPPGTPSEHPNPACLNCDTPLSGKYCANCGQRDLKKRQTLGDMLTNFISSFWSYESKFFTTVSYLFLRPGRLPKDYCEGKRERYYHPARMYVFISFVYFLLLSIGPDSANVTGRTAADDDDPEGSINILGDSVTAVVTRPGQYDSLQASLPEAKRDGWLKRKLVRRQIELNNRFKGKGEEFSETFTSSFAANFPKVVFWLLPIFALLLKLLYLRRDFYVSEHLVFSVFYYDFFFLAGSVYFVFELIPGLGFVSWILVLWIFAYLLLAMKTMYRQTWPRTILKYLLFIFLFAVCVGVGLVVNLVVTLMYL